MNGMLGNFKSMFKNINAILGALLAGALVTAFVLVLIIFGELKEQRLQTALLLAAVNQRVGVASDAAAGFLKTTSKDMLFLQSLLSEEGSGADWSEVGLEKFMERNAAYEELLLFDRNGKCLFRIIQGSDIRRLQCGTMAEEIDKAKTAARELSSGELFLSPLSRYEGKPSLIYAMALKDGRIVTAAVSMESFLEEVRRLAREGEAVFLVDRDGGYLAHPDWLKEKLLGAADNFYSDFPKIEKGVLKKEEVSRLDTDGVLFSFWRISPSESDFALYQGTRNMPVRTRSDEQWILVAVSEKSK